MSQRNRTDKSAPGSVEPIAVIGIGCRFPGGVCSPDDFRNLLLSGRDTVGEVPGERWEYYRNLGPEHAAVLREAVSKGSFLENIDGFDAEFFGIAPREAELMDPQHRILLEVAWEALEHAGIPPAGLGGSDTGVFMGVCTGDYGGWLLEDLPSIEAWTGIGAATCAVANRISHVLDLRGPSMAVDTACSASLVAVHLACQSLRLGESPLALAGGVNLLITPGQTLTLGAAGALAPDGRSKSFDASADGYGRGEGCGVVVLKRLADAQRAGDRVLAVILGSAVNQDGRTNGIMAPCGAAQQHVMARACANAGIAPGTVDYVEAHGTGTRLGDPLEAEALSAVFGSEHPDGQPCLIGSVKSAIGHLEGAAGVAGVIKAVLALYHGEIPPNPVRTRLNPAIGWDGSGLRVVTEPTRWPERGHPRRAGVSGFGYGGTVAHVVLEQPPELVSPSPSPATPTPAEEDCRLFPLSGRSQDALRQHAGKLADWLHGAGSEVPLASAGHTLALRRSHLNQRAVLIAVGRDDLVAKLRRLADGEPAEGVITGSVLPGGQEKPVWVFSGHGSQWAGMGRQLLATEPAFAAVIDAVEPVFTTEIGFSPRQVLTDGDLDEVDRIQTMIFVMQVGIAAVWRAWGVTPAAVIGHSVGEIAAAVESGALTLQDGARLSCRRSKLLRKVAGNGAMAMVSLPFPDVAERLSGRTDIAAAIWASPMSTVISGDVPAVETLVAAWQTEGIAIRRVSSDVAFHSPHMDPLLADLASAAADLSPRPPQTPMYTTALEDPRATPAADGAYWSANLRDPVRLAAAVAAAAEDGHRAFMEISPHPVVTHSIAEILEDSGVEDAFTGLSLRRNSPERDTLLASAAAAHCHGVSVDWSRLEPDGDLAVLPPVSWQRRRLWHEPAASSRGCGPQHDPRSHALLGSRAVVAGTSLRLWRTSLDDSNRPYPGSHTLNGVEIVPAAVLINTFLRAASGGSTLPALADVSMQKPLMTAERSDIQVVQDGSVLRLASARPAEGPAESPAWLTHTTASIRPAAEPAEPLGVLSDDVLRDMRPAAPSLIHERLAEVGVPSTGFEWTAEELLRGDEGLRVRVRTVLPELAPVKWGPAFDAAMSVAPAAFPGAPELRMVVHIDEVVTTADPPESVFIQVTRDLAREDTVHALISDTAGRVVARLAGLRYPVIGKLTSATADPRNLVHEVVWRPLPGEAVPGESLSLNAVLVGPATAVLSALRESLVQAGAHCQVVPGTEALAGLAGGLSAPVDLLVLAPAACPDVPVGEAAAGSAVKLAEAAALLAAWPRAERPRLVCLTAGVLHSDEASQLSLAPLWGACQAIAGQHPGLRAGVIDLDPADLLAAARSVPGLLRAAPGEDLMAVRNGSACAARLVRVNREPARAALNCRADGTYLVTGGLGESGTAIAGWLAGRGARRIVLADTRPFPPRSSWDRPADARTSRQIDEIRALEALGVTIRVLSLDITDHDRAARQLAPDSLCLPAIRGVVHAAAGPGEPGTAADGQGSLLAAIRPEVAGGWALHSLFPPGCLDFLLLMTPCDRGGSPAARAARGAASAFLDALAAHRRAAGGDDAMSFAWMRAREGTARDAAVQQATGITTSQALEKAEFAWRRRPGSFVMPQAVSSEPGTLRPLLSEIGAAQADEEGGSIEMAPVGSQLPDLSPEELREQTLGEVRAVIAREMKLPADDLDPRRPLVEQGLDSVMTVVIRRRLEKRFGQGLPATLLWQQPTISAIADHLAGLLRENARVTLQS